MQNTALRQRIFYGRKLEKIAGKEPDAETGLYYYGARYLDPKTARWLSGDPAMGEYLPSPGQEASKLPGMGGVFNYVNLHAYHYAGNNPVKYVDPDGRDTNPIKGGKSADGYKLSGRYGELFAQNDKSDKAPHAGVDMVSKDRNIVATMKGKVIYAGEHPDGISKATGTLIIVKYENGEYGLYGHLDKNALQVKAGDDIDEGADLGKYYNGKMGASTGAHLHYARYKLDDSKKEDKFENINDFVRQFDLTGYFYYQKTVPADKKLKDGFISVEPGFDR